MNFKEYTITSGDLARIHGVVQSTIFNWTKQGAFPHILTAGGQSRYDQRSGTMLPGEIKRNIADKKWVRPIATIERNSSVVSQVNRRFSEIESNISRILNKLEQIESEIMVLAELDSMGSKSQGVK